MKSLFISNKLDRNGPVRFPIHSLDDLAKGSLSKDGDDLEPIADVIVLDDLVVAPVVVVAVIVFRVCDRSLELGSAHSNVKYLRVIENLALFEIGEAAVVKLKSIFIFCCCCCCGCCRCSEKN